MSIEHRRILWDLSMAWREPRDSLVSSEEAQAQKLPLRADTGHLLRMQRPSFARASFSQSNVAARFNGFGRNRRSAGAVLVFLG